MLLDSLARTVGITVERYQTLRLRAVVQPVAYDCRHDRTVIRKVGYRLAEFGIECEFFDIFKQIIDTLAALAVVHELEQFLEHSRSRSRCGNELDHRQSVGTAFV